MLSVLWSCSSKCIQASVYRTVRVDTLEMPRAPSSYSQVVVPTRYSCRLGLLSLLVSVDEAGTPCVAGAVPSSSCFSFRRHLCFSIYGLLTGRTPCNGRASSFCGSRHSASVHVGDQGHDNSSEVHIHTSLSAQMLQRRQVVGSRVGVLASS